MSKNVLAISGSLRKGSFNTRLAKAIAKQAPAGTKVTVATLDGIPLYNGDVEAADGIPAAVTALKEQILAADAIVLVTPEYNHGIPGVFKNAIDWLSRADKTAIFSGRKVGLVGIGMGGFGTMLSQTAWLQVLRYFGCEVFTGALVTIGGANEDTIAEDGTVNDERAAKSVANYVEALTAWM